MSAPGNNGIVDKESSVLYKSMKPFYNEATGKLELPPQMAQMPGLNAEVLTAMFNAVDKPYIEGCVYDKAQRNVLFAVRLPRHPVQHLR